MPATHSVPLIAVERLGRDVIQIILMFCPTQHILALAIVNKTWVESVRAITNRICLVPEIEFYFSKYGCIVKRKTADFTHLSIVTVMIKHARTLKMSFVEDCQTWHDLQSQYTVHTELETFNSLPKDLRLLKSLKFVFESALGYRRLAHWLRLHDFGFQNLMQIEVDAGFLHFVFFLRKIFFHLFLFVRL